MPTASDLASIIKNLLVSSLETVYRQACKGDIRHSLSDITKAQKLLGYELKIDLEVGLRKTIEWMKTMG